MTKVILSREAADYLRYEHDYLNQFNPPAANAAMAQIRAAIRRLGIHPQIGGPAPTLPGRRQFVVGAYVITYRVERDAVMVSSIRHGRQSIDLDRDDGAEEGDGE
ncbi:type II toxin-antitoxin system RelE/ParE family toxin [Rhizobium sp. 18055]|uniref:type II toxin-antitoxin system RelE/ParE family toxin n=1 Tax=Rhizobium sp. 18055 TaxID=2681403 RepID=UPI00135B0BFE|nr:type II toxin-antitoxin system RelE/ParE family toxin [Rhizobium sp. 18055]